VQRVAVHPELLPVRVVMIVERPPLEVGAVDDERVALPLADRVAVVHRFQALTMGPAVERDDPRVALELVHPHEMGFGLEQLHRVARKHAGGEPAGMQKSRGSSCFGSPVRGSKNGSPPGLSGAKFLLSKIVAFERPRAAPGRYVGH